MGVKEDKNSKIKIWNKFNNDDPNDYYNKMSLVYYYKIIKGTPTYLLERMTPVYNFDYEIRNRNIRATQFKI